MMLVEMFSKIFFRNHIYWDVFENLTFRKFPAIRYADIMLDVVTVYYVINYTSIMPQASCDKNLEGQNFGKQFTT